MAVRRARRARLPASARRTLASIRSSAKRSVPCPSASIASLIASMVVAGRAPRAPRRPGSGCARPRASSSSAASAASAASVAATMRSASTCCSRSARARMSLSAASKLARSIRATSSSPSPYDGFTTIARLDVRRRLARDDRQQPVGVDLVRDADARRARGHRRNAAQLEARERAAVGDELALALHDVDRHRRLAVLERRELLRARDRNRRIARDDLLGEAAHRLDAERQRDHVEQQPVVAVAARGCRRARRPARAAPSATTWSGSRSISGGLPKKRPTASRTCGIRVAPPTITTPLMSAGVELRVAQRLRSAASSVRSTSVARRVDERVARDRGVAMRRRRRRTRRRRSARRSAPPSPRARVREQPRVLLVGQPHVADAGQPSARWPRPARRSRRRRAPCRRRSRALRTRPS